MMTENVTEKDRARAAVCVNCPVCRHARNKQRGPAYLFVRTIEGGLCPFCRAYEKVYGRKAHEPA
jgi:ssDNA-binding Zn-finger/Zn-ribbon topoisomerase 1